MAEVVLTWVEDALMEVKRDMIITEINQSRTHLEVASTGAISTRAEVDLAMARSIGEIMIKVEMARRLMQLALFKAEGVSTREEVVLTKATEVMVRGEVASNKEAKIRAKVALVMAGVASTKLAEVISIKTGVTSQCMVVNRVMVT